MMNIIKLTVPDYVEHISDWVDYRIPEGHCIVDKDVCGCGYTEYCIRPENPFDTILCSPRIVLLENKLEQHPDEPGIFYFDNQKIREEFMNIFGIKTKKSIDKKLNQEFQNYTKTKLMEHVAKCRFSGIPARILCTYDSFYIIKNSLKKYLPNFRVVVDEFSSIFVDSFFKPEVEFKFFSDLQDVPNVTYLSATPMLDKYLEQIDGFRDLPYYKLIWPDFRISETQVHERWVSDVEAEALKIINIYKNNRLNRPWKDIDGIPVYSDEVVFYINSVSAIKRIITKAKLCPSECNIICSRTEQNKKVIKSIKSPDFNIFTIGKVPKKTDPRKMFTFCTKTTYLGADFYSDNAYTVILSDANIQSLVVDVRQDLPQILGRQRLLENPWKNECTVFYKTTRTDEEIDFTEQEFYQYLSNKDSDTRKIISDYMTYADPDKFINSILGYNNEGGRLNYFISLDQYGKPVMNEFMKLAEERAWEMTRKEYRTKYTAIKSMNETKYINTDSYIGYDDRTVQALIDKIKELTLFDQKLELYCSFREKFKNDPAITSRTLSYYKGSDLENLYSHFGFEVCRSVSFRAGELKKKIFDDSMSSPLRKLIYSTFNLKGRYSLRDIKLAMSGIYKKLGIAKTPKAIDITEYFNTQSINLYDPRTKKRSAGYELISMK